MNLLFPPILPQLFISFLLDRPTFHLPSSVSSPCQLSPRPYRWITLLPAGFLSAQVRHSTILFTSPPFSCFFPTSLSLSSPRPPTLRFYPLPPCLIPPLASSPIRFPLPSPPFPSRRLPLTRVSREGRSRRGAPTRRTIVAGP